MASTFEKYVINDDSNLDTWNSGGDNFDLAAQTFTIGNVGDNLTFNVSSVDVKIFKTGAIQDVEVSITEILPDQSPDMNNIISTGTILAADIPTVTGAWKNAIMTTAALKASTQYALVLGGQVTSAVIFISWRQDNNNGAYGGGNTWSRNGTTGVWAPEASVDDAMFQINGGNYAGTLCTLADARNKAGANASSTGSNESLVSDFVLQAESFVNVSTKKNWTDIYSTLNDDVKFILNQIVSNLAAIDIITHDMAGYSSRVEAETMINTYREEVNRALFFLLKENNEDFMVNE